jgi:Domain of unknown function (DUF4382)/Carboxypeptidase regulatory-like domain
VVSARAVLVLAAALSLGSCGVDFWAFESIQNGPNPHSTLVLVWLSDSPVDEAQNVWVTLDRVEMVTDDGVEVLSTVRTRHDLLALRGGVRAQIAREDVPSGICREIRLVLAPAVPGAHQIRVNGTVHDLSLVPTDGVVAVPLNVALEPEGTLEVHVDLDARMSVFEVGGEWLLDPHAIALDAASAGWASGVVRTSTGLPVAGATLSAQQMGEEVSSTRTGSDGRYLLGPLSAGNYTVVATATDHGVDVSPPVDVLADFTTSGVDLVLNAEAGGSLGGGSPVAWGGQIVRVYSTGGFVGLAGVDPLTGRFALPRIAPGVYRVELWNQTGQVSTVTGVVVPLGGSVEMVFGT